MSAKPKIPLDPSARVLRNLSDAIFGLHKSPDDTRKLAVEEVRT